MAAPMRFDRNWASLISLRQNCEAACVPCRTTGANSRADISVWLKRPHLWTDLASTTFADNSFEATEDVFLTTKDVLSEWLEELEPPPTPQSSMQSTGILHDTSVLAGPRMPYIKLPPFNGTLSEWEHFRDRFTSLVIQNAGLTDFARMHYLSSSVTGSALSCISDIPVTADNFAIAWAALTKRFESRRRLVRGHFATLFGLSVVTRESAADLQALCDKVEMTVSALKQLGRTPKLLWNDFLVQLISRNLDPVSRRAWNLKSCDSDELPSYTDLITFVTNRCHALEESDHAAVIKTERAQKSLRVHATNTCTSTNACPLCKSKHYLSACSRFLASTSKIRVETVKRLKRCLNCLSATHSVADCQSQFSCRNCKKRHHSTLHVEPDAPANAETQTVAEPSPPVAAVHTSALVDVPCRERACVLLATARVTVAANSGRYVTVRALLDQGSEATFISESVAQILRAKRVRKPIAISAVGGIDAGFVRQAISITISSSSKDAPVLETTALILKSLTNYAPKGSASRDDLAHLRDLEWADPTPTRSDPIQLIIGADLYGDLLLEGLRRGRSGQPIAQNTIFGWVISGPTGSTTTRPNAISQLTALHCTSLVDLDTTIQKFWEIEEVPRSRLLVPAEKRCEDHFRETHSREANGRYVVRLPFLSPPTSSIGDSRRVAEKQLRHLQRRLQGSPDLRVEYSRFLHEYAQLSHMRRASRSSDFDCRVFIPHHPVIKSDSATTKLRVVFNASCPTSTGVSLNDLLHSGPKLQTELPAILLQWRQHRYVYTADIAKMFRQILVDERDVNYQCILWSPDSLDTVGEYQLLTVTYGMKCAPYLALRVLRCLCEDEGSRYPLAVPILRDQTYVDDVLFGDHDIAKLKSKRDQLISLLRCGHFTLRKWASNSTRLLDDIDPRDHGLACDKSISGDDAVKVLGIVWNPSSDAFRFHVNLDDSPPNSKRAVLSVIARVYDPLGLATPVTISAKILMQALWRLQSGWDAPLPENIFSSWSTLYTQLRCLGDQQIPRWTGASPGCCAELHGFSDASNCAYAASVYLKLIRPDRPATVTLLAGKSRVAPLKTLTIPRLELSAALLLSRLVVFVRETLALPAIPCHCWTDSTIALQWICSDPSRWSVFVSNRVIKIQELLPDATWHHVPTDENPSDCASRGIFGSELNDHPLWWRGPSWLTGPPDSWPVDPVVLSSEMPEAKKLTVVHATAPPPPWDLATRFELQFLINLQDRQVVLLNFATYDPLCSTCSTGFKYGLNAECRSSLIEFSAINLRLRRAVCGRALSCIRIKFLPMRRLIGNTYGRKISPTYRTAVIPGAGRTTRLVR
ncbi:uncharacterized protein [Cardiocondyla obscurior]|uniref:uncharacterized protein n=1 Tax=Cardiocondyla obscurior TaxID=286306 RepID=UPI0039656FFC